MSYRTLVQGWIDSFELATSHPDNALNIVKTTIYNYAPQWLDIGTQMDQLVTENERLKAIVNLIDLKNERDDLKQRLDALEKANADA